MISTHTHPDGTVHTHHLVDGLIDHGHNLPKLHNPVAEPDFVQTAIDLVLVEMGGLRPPTPYDNTNEDKELCINVAATALHTLVALLRKEHNDAQAPA